MKPTLFNTEMVRAILEGRKTVTRRVVKDPYYIDNAEVCRKSGMAMRNGTDRTHGMPYPDRPYHPGDILWVRETWGVYCKHWWEADRFEYRASFEPENTPYGMTEPPKWCPSIHMPKEAARLFLRVTGVRVERLQEITFGETQDEGIWHPKDYPGREDLDVFGPFAVLWDSTIKPKDLSHYGWDANPWVWVVEFERISKEAALGGGGDG